MKVIKQDFKFSFEGKTIKAHFDKFKVYSHPQYWVLVGGLANKPMTFTFYEVEEKGKIELFWFELQDKKELVAKKIAKALEKFVSVN
jgi:hypothetical protein